MMSRLITVLCLSLAVAAGLVLIYLLLAGPCPDYECEPRDYLGYPQGQR